MREPRRETTGTARRGPAPVPAVLYNVEEAAEALRLSRWTLYELIRSGRLRSVKQGHRRLVPVAALDEYVALLESEGAA